MKERPILFSAPMVLALLAGTKTQTRRILKQPLKRGVLSRDGWRPFDPELPGDHPTMVLHSPYGAPGDCLWVRETTIIAPPNWADDPDSNYVVDGDGKRRLIQYLASQPNREAADDWGLKATPSIHMFRWASRLTLEITDVRAERLQAISDEDAKAEGARHFPSLPSIHPYGQDSRWSCFDAKSTDECLGTPRFAFGNLWNSINGAGSWDLNPWVWALTFRRLS